MKQDLSERDLIRLYQAGDNAAGQALYYRYHRKLAKETWRFVKKSKSAFEFNDLFATAQLGFFEALQNFDTTRNIALWTYAARDVVYGLSTFTRLEVERGFIIDGRAARWLRTNYRDGITPEEVMAGAHIKSRREAQLAIYRCEASRRIDPSQLGGAGFVVTYDTTENGRNGPNDEDSRETRFALDVEEIKRRYDPVFWPILGGKRPPLPPLDLADALVAKAREDAAQALAKRRADFLEHIKRCKAKDWSSVPIVMHSIEQAFGKASRPHGGVGTVGARRKAVAGEHKLLRAQYGYWDGAFAITEMDLFKDWKRRNEPSKLPLLFDRCPPRPEVKLSMPAKSRRFFFHPHQHKGTFECLPI